MDPGAELFAQLLGTAVMGGITSAIAVHKGRSAVGWFFVGFLTGCIGLIIICCMPHATENVARLNHMETEHRRLQEQLKHEQLRNESFQSHTRTRIDAHDSALSMGTRQIGHAGGGPAGYIAGGTGGAGGAGGAGGGYGGGSYGGGGYGAPPPASQPIVPGPAPGPAPGGYGPSPAPTPGYASGPAPVQGYAPGPGPDMAAPAPPASFINCEWYVKFGARRSQPLTFDKLKKFYQIGNLTPDTPVSTNENQEWMQIQNIPGLLEQLSSSVTA